jgi:hypothetical protein
MATKKTSTRARGAKTPKEVIEDVANAAVAVANAAVAAVNDVVATVKDVVAHEIDPQTPSHPAASDDAPGPKPTPTHDAIAARAHQIHLERGGTAFENWIEAERELGGR